MIKQTYNILEGLNRPDSTDQVVYYSIPHEEESPDGKQLVSHNITIPIIE